MLIRLSLVAGKLKALVAGKTKALAAMAMFPQILAVRRRMGTVSAKYNARRDVIRVGDSRIDAGRKSYLPNILSTNVPVWGTVELASRCETHFREVEVVYVK